MPPVQTFQQFTQEINNLKLDLMIPQDNIIDINLDTVKYGEKIKQHFHNMHLLEGKVALMFDPGNRILVQLQDNVRLEKFK